MRYILSILLWPALLSATLAQDNEAEKLFRAMEKKIKAAEAFEVAFTYQEEKRTAKGSLLLTKDNKARLKISGHFQDKRNATIELLSDGKQLKTKGARFFVGSNGMSGMELGEHSEWETPKNFHAQLGALQVWANSKRDKVKALADYKKGLALGGSRPLPELFAAAGCRFDFSDKTIGPLIQLAQTELAALPG